MDRNREGRRASMAAPPNNGLPRRRHRSSSLRDSPEEDGQVELTEPAASRLRDRGLKKDRDRDRDREREREMRDRDRERERERDRSNRSKRRRENRMMHGGGGGGSIREDGGDDTSEESVNDDEDEDEDDAGGLRMLPPASSATAATGAMSSNHHAQQLHLRKSFPPSGNKVFRGAAPAAAPPPTWKAADEMIGVSVPRKARSASTKRTHDWVSGGGGGGVAAAEPINRQSSTSPVRMVSAAASPVAAAPVSPSSSNVSIRKKMKPNGGAKPRPPKSTSKSSSSNPEELEIEIAEVLYGLMTQSQAAPSKKEIVSNDSANKFDSNKSSSDAKSRVSSPISNSTPSQAPSPSPAPLSAVAPKRKRPRQVSDFSNMRSSPGSSMKTEIEHQSPKTEVNSPNLENNNSGSAMADNVGDVPYGFTSIGNEHQGLPLEPPASAELKPLLEEEGKSSSRDVLLSKEEVSSPKRESSAVRVGDNHLDVVMATATASASVSSTIVTRLAGISAIEGQRDEKFQIDLMAPPPQLRSSPDREGEINFADHRRMAAQVDAEMRQMMKDKETAERIGKIGKSEPVNMVEKTEEKVSKAFVEEVEESKKPDVNKERNIDLQFDLERPDRDSTSMVSGSSNRPQHHVPRHHQPTHKSTKVEPNTEKTVHPSPLPLPMSMASWPNGLPSMGGFVAPLQGVVSMDGNTIPATPIQPIFTQPRPKRCATHCYIARNIHYLQQFMKMNPFWPTAAGAAPMFGAKPCNLNVVPPTELHGNMAGGSLNSVQDKGQGLAIFPGHPAKDKASQAAMPDPAQRKQQVVLQQALPPVGPSNILHGPAFIFPFNQQQAAVAAASVRPGSAKSTTPPGSSAAPNSVTASASTTAPPMSFVGSSGTAANPMSFMGASATAPTAMSFNYPNISANETQYLAILQNNAYPFPMPAVGAPPNYRGSPHAQAMPLFSGSFYSSQMIHPSQLQQQQPPPSAPSQPQQISQGHQNTSSGSSSSQKHLQMQQQRQQQGTAVNGGGGNVHNYPVTKARSSQQPQQLNQHIAPPQTRIHENEVGAEDSPSTGDSRVPRATATMNVYGQNFAMPIHPQNFALMTPPTALASASGNSNEKKQQQQQSQQQGSKSGVESLPPQTFAMSFAPMNGSTATGIDISSMAHNHAILQSLPESTRHNYQIMAAAAAAHQAQQKKTFRISEESKTGGGSDLSNAEEDRKGGGLAGKSGQSIAFSRPDQTDTSGSAAIPGNSVIDSSSRNLNLASTPARTSRSPMSNSMGTPGSHLQAQLQQQQILHLQKQQHQNQQQLNSSLAARSKNPPTSNGSAYSEHLIPSSSVAAKFPNSLSSFPQNLVQTSNNSSSPAQSPQWKNSTRTPTSQIPSSLASSSTSSHKNLPLQQQSARTHQQSHTQISFSTNQKPSSTAQGQQPSNSNNQCPSPPMMVGSPTTSSISKGASGSPRTNASATNSGKNVQAASLSSQQAKNTQAGPSQRSSPSILGNPQITSTSGATKSQQQQLSKQHQQLQQHLFFSNPYMQQAQAHAHAQVQAQHSSSSAASASSGYYLQRRRPEQSQQGPVSSSTPSTGMLSLSSSATLPSASTSDPAKAIAAAAAAASNMKGGGLPSQGIIHAAQFVTQSSGNAHPLMPTSYSFVHPVPAAVQVKPAEQKQPAGNDNLHACWQPEKK